MTAPVTALRTIQTVPRSIKDVVTCTVNGLLAADLATDESETHGPWRAVLPTREDFSKSLPVMWPFALQQLLPPASLAILEAQKRKVSLDWDAVASAFPTVPYDRYLFNWFVVSTRTFYYTSPEIEINGPLDSDDCLALVPYADYFNHANVGCQVKYSESGYEVLADRQIEKGEEVYLSYGNHNNDFLLVEYGFLLEQNQYDELSLDEVILPLFSKDQRQALKKAGFLGGFVLDKESVCYRTQAALRLMSMPIKAWQRSLAKGFDYEDEYREPVDRYLLKAFSDYLNLVDERLRQVSLIESNYSQQKDTLRKRWEQMRAILNAAICRMED